VLRKETQENAMLIECPHCSHPVNATTLREAIYAASRAKLESAPARKELIDMLLDNGPLTLKQIEAAPRKVLATRCKTVTPSYLRRMLVDLNTALAPLPGVVVHVSYALPGFTSDNPAVFFWIVEDEVGDLVSADDTGPHVVFTRRMMEFASG
jgi:hypothetical protein